MQKKVILGVQTIAIIIGFALCTAFAIIFIHYNYIENQITEYPSYDEENTEINYINDTHLNKQKICTTAGCNESATTLLKNINFNIDPCNNFFEFACGSFIKNTNIPSDKSYVQTIKLITDKVEKQVLEIISEPIQPDDIQPFILTKQLYKACINEKIIEERGVTPLTNILNKLGGWPVLEKSKWNETNFIWYKTLIEVAKIGTVPDVFFSVYIDNEPKNNTNYVLVIDESFLGLYREYFMEGLESEVVDAYFEFMNNVAVAMGADNIHARDELREMLLFEMKLANLTLSVKERQNVNNLYKPTTIKQLQKDYPSIPWLNYINNLLYSMVNITVDEPIINTVPQYIKDIEMILKNTPKRTLANYIMWRVIIETIDYVSQEYRKLSDDFYSVMYGISEQQSRDKTCIEYIDSYMEVAVSSLYVRKYFKKEFKSETADLVQNIKSEFKNMLVNVDWMDNTTKQNALEKIVALYAHVAYPDELMDDNKIINYYKNVQFNESMFFESLLNLSVFYNTKAIEKLRKPFNKTKWTRHSSSADVNAFYSPTENSIELPAGILQGDFFSNDRPKYMNYGSIGFVIGHEITHGFDDFGREFDKDGNQVDWWEPVTNEAYVKKAECIINQYGNYSVKNLTLNGENTHNENIADNSGIKCAYRAYKRWSDAHDPEPGLPGLSFTPKQMFWISMATTWCSKYRTEYLRDIVTTDSHSPAEFRVNGVVSNQEEFAKDFGCPKGTPMNPAIKCQVW